MEAEGPLIYNQKAEQLQVPDYLKKTPEDFAQILLGLDEFKDKKKLIPYFSQYEFTTQKEKMLDFWGRVIERVLSKYEKTAVLSVDYLQHLFNFNGFQPMGLTKVIHQLTEENSYIFSTDKLKLLRLLDLDTSSEQQRLLEEQAQNNLNA